MVTCPQCGLVQPDGAAFCDECGAPLGNLASGSAPQAYAPPPSQNYSGATVMASVCPTCGTPILPGTQFCDNCGASLTGASAPDVGYAPGPAGGFPPPVNIPAPGGAQTCPSCGAPLEAGSAFCDMCGARISGVQPSSISPETQVQSGGMPGGAPPPIDPFSAPVDNWDLGGSPSPYEGMPYGDPTIVPGQVAGAPPAGPAYGSASGGAAPWGGPGDATYVAGQPDSAPVGVPYSPPPVGYDPGLSACPQGRLVVQTTNATILFPPGKSKLLIGREDPVSSVFPDIDMTNYGGDEGGVSRSHAQIYMQGGQLVIEDLQSVNFTFVNKQKLTPYEPYPLNDGDTIRLGRVKLSYYQ